MGQVQAPETYPEPRPTIEIKLFIKKKIFPPNCPMTIRAERWIMIG